MYNDMGTDGAALAAMVVGGSIFAVVLFGVLMLLLSRMLYICPPSKVLIFSGRKHQLPDGSEVGYRVIHGGRGFRIPFLETVSELDMRIFPVQVAVQNAFSKGGIPLAVQAIANVKIASDPEHLRGAAERFLDVPVQRLAEVAQDTLEGALREVLAELTPEEVNEDRLKFAEKLMENAGDDFARLGLQLDVLKIQHVSDEQGYLTNLGREAIANMLRDAENAENAANQTVAEAQSTARMQAETAQKEAEAEVLCKKNEYETQLATLKAEAESAENEATVDAETARATAEQELQGLRGQFEQLRLACDVVLPAQAHRRAQELRAQGEAYPFIEDGKARAAALSVLAAEWAAAGAQGREVYVLGHIKEIAEAAIARTAATEVGELSVVDGGDGASFGAVIAAFPSVVAKVMEETGSAVGVDIAGLFNARKAGG
jgi:flotillin